MPDLLEVICDLSITQNGDFVRCEDGISLHSKIVDLTYDADWQTADGGGGDPKPEKKKEPEATKGHEDDSKKEHKESVKTENSGQKDSQSEPKKKLV